ncbi:MAG: hypothetical protein EHM14_04605 [Methanothrix sp.]|nr:MAG: hypothetical protein EHM14_04605 [Methanothrix sp.]
MRKMLITAMLVGMLLIGAASATNFWIPKGTAKSCSDAFAKGGAYVDIDVCKISAANVDSWAVTNTWQYDNAKLDPVSISYANGAAGSTIDATINTGFWVPSTAKLDATAASQSTAFNFAQGSEIASGSTETFNIANTNANEYGLSSCSVAGSESNGFATGIVDPFDTTSVTPYIIPVPTFASA